MTVLVTLLGMLIGILILTLAAPWISDWADRYYEWADERIRRKKYERYLHEKEVE